jgi:predicted oxidoreductase
MYMTTTIPLHKHGIQASRLVLGCMGFGGGWDSTPLTAEHTKQAHAAVEAALSIGINMFDHADIYTCGKAEQVFGQVLKERPELRDQIILQSKCGIRRDDGPGFPGRFDFSKEHIRSSVEGILKRLGVEYIDILLLHRPDPLMEPEEIANVFRELKQSGKVKNFGVSNMSAAQIQFLQKAIESPLLVNQLELSLLKLDWLDSVIHVNQVRGTNVSFPEGTMEYCQMENIQIQAWSPLAKGLFTGKDLEGQAEPVKKTAELVQSLAQQKDTTPEAIVLAFLMRHPAGIQPVIGTVNPQRIRACSMAEQVVLTREEWYTLYITSRGFRMP